MRVHIGASILLISMPADAQDITNQYGGCKADLPTQELIQ
jgi:hypothetical protein